MTQEEPVMNVPVKLSSIDDLVKLLQIGIENTDINLITAYNMPMRDNISKNEKQDLIVDIRKQKEVYQEFLKYLVDYRPGRYYKGGRHNVPEKTEGDLKE